MKARPLCLWFAAALAALGGASYGSRDTITVKTEVHVLRGDARERLRVSYWRYLGFARPWLAVRIAASL